MVTLLALSTQEEIVQSIYPINEMININNTLSDLFTRFKASRHLADNRKYVQESVMSGRIQNLYDLQDILSTAYNTISKSKQLPSHST